MITPTPLNGQPQTPETPAPAEPEALERVRRLMAAHGLSKADVARQAGLPASTLTEVLNGTYRGRAEEKIAALVRWAESYGERREQRAITPREGPFAETSVARGLLTLFAYCQSMGDIGIVYSGAGMGKTRCARAYQARSSSVHIATMAPECASLIPALETIAEAMGFRDFGVRSGRALSAAIKDRLRDTDGLLIIDEAQHLTRAALEQIRALHDAVGVGVVLLGNQPLYDRIYGRAKGEFAQFYSRIGPRQQLRRAPEADVRAIAAGWGIEGREATAFLVEISRREAALRGVAKTCRLAIQAAGGAAGRVDRAALRAAYAQLGVAAEAA